MQQLTWQVGDAVRHGAGLPGSAEDLLLRWHPVFGLLWVLAFGALVLRRRTAARVLTVLAALSAAGVTVAIAVVIRGLGAASVWTERDLVRWGWPLLCVAAVFLVPRDARRPTRWWFGALALGGALGVPLAFAEAFPSWTLYLLPDATVHYAMLAGMVVALATRSPRWLLALALFAGAVGASQLAAALRQLSLFAQFDLGTEPVGFFLWLTGVQVVLAAACAAVGVLLLLRLPRRPAASVPAES